jgi:hypothetical protein
MFTPTPVGAQLPLLRTILNTIFHRRATALRAAYSPSIFQRTPISGRMNAFTSAPPVSRRQTSVPSFSKSM